MVNLIIGTKAQFIKMAPIAHLLDREGIDYTIIDLSQHGALTGSILADFGLTPQISFLYPSGANVSSISSALQWAAVCASKLLLPRSRLRRSLSLSAERSVALIHGDTLSTLLGYYVARKVEMEVALVEAGLSSGALFSPFPEEAIRRHVERRADYLFAPGAEPASRLSARGVRGKVIDTTYNTGRDALHLMSSQIQADAVKAPSSYTVVTLHRLETLRRRKRLVSIVNHLLRLASHLPSVRFFLHEPTKLAMTKAGLLPLVESHPNIEIFPLLRYPDFVTQLIGASYVMTDGGSIQEEASYLGKPCLILRCETERQHGLGATARLTSLDVGEDLEFLQSVPVGVPKVSESAELRASQIVLENINAV